MLADRKFVDLVTDVQYFYSYYSNLHCLCSLHMCAGELVCFSCRSQMLKDVGWVEEQEVERPSINCGIAGSIGGSSCHKSKCSWARH